MLTNRILPNIGYVVEIVADVANAMIRKTFLPDLHVRSKLFFRPVREAAFDELHGLLQARCGSEEHVNMIGHHDELVQQVRGSTIVVKSVDKKFRPAITLEKRTASPSGRGDHVCMARICGMFSGRSHTVPQRLKPQIFDWPLRRALKARPFKAFRYSRPSRPVISSIFNLFSQSCGHESLAATGNVNLIAFRPFFEYLIGIVASQKPRPEKTRR